MIMNVPFSKEEIECPCGCGQCIIDLGFMRKVVIARWIAGVLFIVNSWNRCPKHNREVGGSEDSEHIIGYAVDIEINNARPRFVIIDAAIRAGFNRIGIYSWGLHLGAGPNHPQNVIWIGD